MQRNVFLINKLLQVRKIKWRGEVLKVNQQRLGPAWFCRELHHRKLRPKCDVVKVTAHLCLVKTFQGAVKRHVCSGVAAPQQGSFLVWPWNCLLSYSDWLLLQSLTWLNVLLDWNYYYYLQLVHLFDVKWNKSTSVVTNRRAQKSILMSLQIDRSEGTPWSH